MTGPRIAVALLVSSQLTVGCTRLVKSKTKVDVPPAYQQAKNATLEELVQLVNGRYAAVNTLTVAQLQVEFTGVSADRGYLEQYPKGKGYLVVKSPASIYVNILNPLTSSTVAAMASQGELFQIWVPRENKYFTGKTSVELNEKNPFFNVRPQHILQGLLVEPLPLEARRLRHFLQEDQDAEFKYYKIGVVELPENSQTARLTRNLWLERSVMRLVRQQYFGKAGEVISDIRYNRSVDRAGLLVNTGVEIRRPNERYTVCFELEGEGVEVNQELKEGVFDIPRPEGAELVIVERNKP